jgi:hypothetical protein
VTCPCFVEGEEAGAVFSPPAEQFPIEILRVGIGWGSQLGSTAPSVEDSIYIYPNALPDPGSPIFSLAGPQLVDGAINEFDLEPFAGEILVDAPPFTVSLRFLNSSAGNPFLPSVVHDGAGCAPGDNVVKAIPGGWVDGCSLGITGNWVFYVVYRRAECGGSHGSVPDGVLVAGSPLAAELVDGGDVRLTWTASCAASDDDYAVYEGAIGSYYSHDTKICTTGGATTATITPDPGSVYYLVVPRDAVGEGSYGRDSEGQERPVGAGQCVAQGAVSCP